MSDAPDMPDEAAFPQTQEALRSLGSPALDAQARARHLHAIRAKALELGALDPTGASAAHPARRASASPQSGLAGLRWRGRRAAAVAGVWMGVASMGTGVAAAAAMDDLPGDALYGLKRAVETVRLHLPGDDSNGVHRRLELAHRRLEEAALLQARGADDDVLADVLGDAQDWMDEAGARAANDAELTADVAESASMAQTRLSELLDGGLPDHAAQRAREAIEAATERARHHGTGSNQRAGQSADKAPSTERGKSGNEQAGQDRSTPGGSSASATPSESRNRDRGSEQVDGTASPAPPNAPPEASSAGSDDDDRPPSERGRSSQPSGQHDGQHDGQGESLGRGRSATTD